MKNSLLGLLFMLAIPAWASTIVINPDSEVSSIKQGIALAENFDTLRIQKGLYREWDIIVDKPLTIIGENFPTIDGQNKGEIFTIVADHVSIEGLFIINVGTSYTRDYAAIRVKKGQHFTIKNNVLEKLFFGIYLEKAKHGSVFHNKIIGDAIEEFNSGNGIQLWYCTDVKVERNIVEHVRDGIYLEFSDQILIADNRSSNNLRYGLHFMFSNNDVYRNNIFENNGAGVAVMFSKFIEMYDNTFSHNWGTAAFGLLLKEINDAQIEGNLFEENTTGIHTEGSNRINYVNNDFVGNGWAIKVRGACYTNSFRANNFMYNSFDLAYNSKLNDNIIDGNYWSSYTGYDLDRDGTGDVPYRPVRLFSYIVNRTPETIILLRSLFMDIIDFSERVSPVFTPDHLMDHNPKMKKLP